MSHTIHITHEDQNQESLQRILECLDKFGKNVERTYHQTYVSNPDGTNYVKYNGGECVHGEYRGNRYWIHLNCTFIHEVILEIRN
jgi:hypothetical protein